DPVLSAPDLLRFLHGQLPGGDRDWLPATLPEAAQLIELARLGGALDIDHLIDDQRQTTVLRVFLRRASYVTVDRLLGELRRAAPERFSGAGEEVSFVGDVMVSQTTVGLIVSDQVRTLLTALVMVLFAASVMFRSLVGGLFAVMPLALSVLLNFAFMGYAGIPLGIATSMFASLAIGIGVDYAIHFLGRHARSLQAADSRAALRTTLATTGRAIFYNAAVVAPG